jgi:translocation and assembly module TamB
MMPKGEDSRTDETTRVSLERKALRAAAWSLVSLVLLAAVLLAAVLIAGNTAGGRALIERITARLTKGTVQLVGLGGSFPSQIELGRLLLSDDEGVWLTADHISLRWSPLDMIAYHVKVESVHVVRLDIARRPMGHSTSHREPKVPVIDVGQLSIDSLVLEPQLVGTRAALWVRGNGHLESLADAHLHLIARRWEGNGDYEVQLAFDPTRMDANLKLEEPAGGPLEHLAQVPGLGALEVIGSLTGPRTAEKIELSARAGDLQARIDGVLDLRSASADLQYTLDSGAVTPRPDIAWQRLQSQGRWIGSLRAPQASGHLSIQALQLPERVRLDRLEANLSAAGRALSLDATANGLEIASVPREPRELLQASPLRLHATWRLEDPTRPLQLALEQRLFALKAQAITTGERSATFTLSLPDLAPFAALAKQHQVRGSATVSGKLAQTPGAIRLDADAAAALTAPSMWARVLGRAARLRLGASLTAQSIDIDRLLLTGQALSVSASGNLQRLAASRFGALRGRWSLNLPNLAAVSPDVQGTLKVTGQLAGALQALGVELQAVTTLSVRGSAPGSMAVNVQAHGLPSAPSAAIEAKGSFAGSPVQLEAFFERRAADTYRLEIRRTDWKSAHLEANLMTGANLSEGRGSLQLRIGQLADLAPLIGKPIQGRLAGNLALSPEGGRTHVRLDAEAHDVSAGKVSGDAKLSGSGPIDALRLQLATQSAEVLGKPVSLTAAAQLNVSSRVLELAQTEASYHGQTLRLLSPARLTFADGLRVSDLRLGLQNAVLELGGEVVPALNAHASLRGIDAALVNSFAPQFLKQGTLSAEARLHGTVGAPWGRASLQVSALRFGDPGAAGLPLLDLHANAELMGTMAQVDAALSAGSASQLKLTGRAPLNASSTVDLSISGKLDAAYANAFLEAHGERAAGILTVDATISGPAQTAEIGGSIQLDHGDIRDYAQGVHFGDITAHIVGGQGILRIASLTARAGSGELSMAGTLGVLQHKMPIDLKLTAKNAQPITNDIVTANLDADMTLQGTLREQMEVAGTIRLNRALVGIPNSLPPNVQVLNVVRPGQAPPAPVAHRLVIDLDIRVDAPRNILVQGRGLNAELGGEVRIHGTTQQPAVSGGFQLIRGTFSLASTQLNFTMGDVSFNGAGLHGRIDPTLDFTAQASAADATVTMHITGFADSPQFELSSTPPLPQDEILARLLFGETASQLTAVQLAQIGAALVSMTGVGGAGINPLEKIQRALGLNVLTVGSAPNTGNNPNQSTGASVTAGRYLFSRVFVAATQSTTGVSQLQVDVDLTKHLKLQTRLGNGTATAQGVTPENDPGSSVGLTYQFQY